jgi:mannosyltransferase OCH1-like enzyme
MLLGKTLLIFISIILLQNIKNKTNSKLFYILTISYLILKHIVKDIDNHHLHYINPKVIKKTAPMFNRIKKKVKDKKTLPKNLFQTHYNKSIIPQKVRDNIKKYASDYKYFLLDDNDAIKFLKEEYGQLLVDTYNSIKGGAHKADLLRYCLLYRYGGIYIDIKMQFTKPLNKIFTKNNTLYTVNSILPYTCYQGLIASPPCNEIFAELINHLISIDKKLLNDYYHVSCEHFYKFIENKTGIKSIDSGNYVTKQYNITLFQEHNNCLLYSDLKPDKYGVCSKIIDVNRNVIMNTRYHDYPWK